MQYNKSSAVVKYFCSLDYVEGELERVPLFAQAAGRGFIGYSTFGC